MYLNYQLVPGSQIILRNGETRDCEYLASVFTEIWTGIPENDRAAILARSYGRVIIDVEKGVAKLRRAMGKVGMFELSRALVDTSPRNVLVHFVACNFANRLHDSVSAKTIARHKRHARTPNSGSSPSLSAWGYPSKIEPEFTQADELRIAANLAAANKELPPAKPDVQEPKGQ